MRINAWENVSAMGGIGQPVWLQRSAAASLLFAAALARAQTAPAANPVFDISSVKWNKSGSHSTRVSSNDERYLATNVTLKNLLQSAYNIRPELISGLPPWAEDAHFDIEAKVLDPSTVAHIDSAQRAAMVRQVLEDRVQLKAHIEPKTLPVFDLVIAKTGSKLTPSPPDLPSPNGRGTGVNGRNNELDAHDLPMSGLADALTHQLDRPVIDKTGLTGKFDITLKFAREDISHASHGDTSADDLPSIFTAVEEQLGLKLEPGKGPVDTLVVDQLNQPSEN
jgi:uncharacterized protein (TIGR03435 family)